jgi:hypothetical protein
MRYATWDVTFADNIGTTPEPVIRELGGQASGAFMIGPWSVCGYLSDDAVIDGASHWNCVEITQAQALALAGPTATLNADGYFIFPKPDAP